MSDDAALPGALPPRQRSVSAMRSISALILREMESVYGRSPGGYVWAVAEPVAGVLLMTVIFSLVLRAPSLGSDFAMFYATGFLPFVAYQTISSATMNALKFARQLLEYPAVTFMDAVLARFILNVMTTTLVGVIVILAIIELNDLNPIIRWESVLLAALMTVSLAFGVGVFNCYMATRFELWGRLWSVVSRPLLIISAVLFIPEDLPSGLRGYLMYNPLAHITSEMRRGWYGTYEAQLVDPVYVFGIALGLAVVGCFLLLHHHRDAMNR
ncbi:ABC transporter permease [Palleronia caenipelagi]|uniref:Transport permease protein n=1 Tax=Palleronia caenipelagi TaxID=2489174 RepID=A0A547Q7Q0_9RHOB|nr:ABC transporter permease [Palleronia caenipelagi]TRD22417.1 sugar ABC transporter permease [Palleronia caenipelagi]